MPDLTIDSPVANATVSMYFFTASGLANQVAASPVPLQCDDPPAYLRIQCDLFKAGDTTATATIEECPYTADEVAETLTWYAAFFPLQVMTGARLRATLYLRGEVAAVASQFIDVADVMPSVGVGIGGDPGDPMEPVNPLPPAEPPPSR